jgi:hypothetical protein
MYVCVYVCMCVCVYVCMCVCISVYRYRPWCQAIRRILQENCDYLNLDQMSALSTTDLASMKKLVGEVTFSLLYPNRVDSRRDIISMVCSCDTCYKTKVACIYIPILPTLGNGAHYYYCKKPAEERSAEAARCTVSDTCGSVYIYKELYTYINKELYTYIYIYIYIYIYTVFGETVYLTLPPDEQRQVSLIPSRMTVTNPGHNEQSVRVKTYGCTDVRIRHRLYHIGHNNITATPV